MYYCTSESVFATNFSYSLDCLVLIKLSVSPNTDQVSHFFSLCIHVSPCPNIAHQSARTMSALGESRGCSCSLVNTDHF